MASTPDGAADDLELLILKLLILYLAPRKCSGYRHAHQTWFHARLSTEFREFMLGKYSIIELYPQAPFPFLIKVLSL